MDDVSKEEAGGARAEQHGEDNAGRHEGPKDARRGAAGGCVRGTRAGVRVSRAVRLCGAARLSGTQVRVTGVSMAAEAGERHAHEAQGA